MNQPQAVIQVNLGTSDLAVLIKNYGFIPLWDRDEINDKAKQEIWKNRSLIIVDKLCPELNVQIYEKKGNQRPFKFIELTEKLFQAYEKEPEKWGDRIYPSRLLGVIEKAKETFEVSEINVFVSKQEPLHESDCWFLFKILQKWFKEKKDLELKAKFIPEDINLSLGFDRLSEYYYKEIKNVDTTKIILISHKGGTPNMTNALKQQIALSSIERKIILIDPELVVENVLDGKPSPCKLTSYWKYIRIQKYEAVEQLLNRWDFDGAIQILKDWQNYLNFLLEHKVIDENLEQSSELIRLVLQKLEIARNFFNLDNSWKLDFEILPDDDLGSLQKLKSDYNKVLNLYTQCLIFWELNQVANFSFRMSSFCEEILHELFQELGKKYFNKKDYPHNWFITKSEVESKLWQLFEDLEASSNQNTQSTNKNLKKKSGYKLLGRFSKRNFVEALIQFRDRNKEKTSWQKIANSLKKLDYWIDLRNRLTHSAKGFSKNSMADLLEKDRDRYNQKDKDEMVIRACKPNEILNELTNIMQNMGELLNQSYSPYIGLKEPHYIYSEAKQWVLKKLQQEE
jgi:hypothetical protein